MPQFEDTSIRDIANAPHPKHMPVAYVSLYDAIEFCNALSVKLDLKPFYKFSELETIVRDNYGHITNAIVEPNEVGQHGFRLLTEVEWEDACRAMSAKGYCFGESETLLPDYAVLRSNQAEICGLRIPNAWGLFDMHGNLNEWCWDSDGFSGSRGGSFGSFNPYAPRSASRNFDSPNIRYGETGFRISRTP
jgi:sulfatase modifying factor 1